MTELARTEQGAVTIAPAALHRIVLQAVGQVEGARVRRPRRSLRVEIEGSRARATLPLTIRRGLVLPQVAREVQERVAKALHEMLEVEVDGVDVSVEEIT
ncbi:MAG: hypothetical protein C5B48_15750 [Candidatus Rokuibacteriota bacterium]|nr:MAG: hypothetical protein C5B48_15750 [Candidatus Rokubacteria bacterium]